MNGKRALVCGASQGIGRAAAEELAGLGCRLVVLARSRDRLEELVTQLPRAEEHTVIALDISDREELAKLLESQVASGGPIHIVVNNTGGPPGGPLLEADEENFLRGFQNHILVASLIAQKLTPQMKHAGYGRIVNVLSTSVKAPIPNLGVSNTIRGAMANWAKTMAHELAPHGITVNNVLPGYTETPRLENLLEAAAERTGSALDQVTETWKNKVPARRFAQPREVAAAIAFLASPAAGYINGINLPVDGGRTVCL